MKSSVAPRATADLDRKIVKLQRVGPTYAQSQGYVMILPKEVSYTTVIPNIFVFFVTKNFFFTSCFLHYGLKPDGLKAGTWYTTAVVEKRVQVIRP